MGRYRKKPVVIAAVLWTGKESALEEIFNLVDFETLPGNAEYVRGGGIAYIPGLGVLEIPTLEGVMRANPGDWIIRGVKGEVYPCKPEIFEATYEKVDDEV